ncbi:MAG: hypothetical protein COV79_02685 [Parcubacteria group bacterium CG11_big_fil_rev_8_21_14_0_20_41_14]|nr:MAG: hypothetical protein COW93_01870 [Parcubacteria group bacterium CG22_combo_CG10-13_8_21_14_all_41_9]PIQ79994.1 MAG: hypothetical protein COV79_02685 [Parcubacteria group bacterium CG11_big_fil_rev_8_21_14_0_20_41_14]
MECRILSWRANYSSWRPIIRQSRYLAQAKMVFQKRFALFYEIVSRFFAAKLTICLNFSDVYHNSMGSNQKIFISALLAILASEVLSFIAYANPGTSPWIFGLVAIAIIIITVYRLEWGVFIGIAELIVGSLGKMFVLEPDGSNISIRMAIWIIVMLVWLAQALSNREISFLRSKLKYPVFLLWITIIWAIVFGLIRGNSLGAIFSDVNNYFYFALIFPVYGVLRSRRVVERLHYVFSAAVIFLSLKTIALFYIFSHEFFNLQDTLYSWLRATRLAEITNIDPNVLLSRVFMQSHIWILFLLFLYLAISLKNIIPFIYKSSVYNHSAEDEEEKINPVEYRDARMSRNTTLIRVGVILSLLILPLSAIIMSFSRSFWLAGIIAFVLLFSIYFVRRLRKRRVNKFFVFVGFSCLMILASIGLTLGVASFPIGKGATSADLLRQRASKFTGEAAVSSRYAQMIPLLGAIAKHPVVGSGFGTSVTYTSQDPRVLEKYPDGKYSTTSFELGWLEIWLKLGLIGVLAYLYLLYRICRIGYDSIKRIPSGKIKKYALAGLCVGLIAVALAHGVSPYLNHPLGIGIVIVCISLVERKYFKRSPYL